MPNKPKSDKSQCRYCRLREPFIIIKRIKGIPQGECKQCNRNRHANARLKDNCNLGLYRSMPELIAPNVKVLGMLQPGAYALYSNTTKEQSGFILIRRLSVYFEAFGLEYLFEPRTLEIASFISNFNLFIDSKPLKLPNAETIGLGLQRINPAEQMVWFDSKLRDYAVKLVEGKLIQAKQRNMRIARSNNPKHSTTPKPSE